MYQLLWYDAVQEAARAGGKRSLACEPTLSTICNRLHVCADVMNAASVGVTHEVPRVGRSGLVHARVPGDGKCTFGPNQHTHSVVIPLNPILPLFGLPKGDAEAKPLIGSCPLIFLQMAQHAGNTNSTGVLKHWKIQNYFASFCFNSFSICS
jgi:hypothetical protein